MKVESDIDDSGADEAKIKACLACLAPNLETAEFCVECGTPFGGLTALTPMETVRSEGAFWGGLLPGRKSSQKPTVLKMLVVWVLMLPLSFISGAVALREAIARNGFMSFVYFWVGVGIACFGLSCLYGVTRDYLRPYKSKPKVND